MEEIGENRSLSSGVLPDVP